MRNIGWHAVWIAMATTTHGGDNVTAGAQGNLSEIERAQGFVSMFDGTRAGFQDHFVAYKPGDTLNAVLPDDWQADPAVGAMITEGLATTYIRSAKPYSDFDFRFDYRNDGDGGVFYRFTTALSVPYGTGLEYSVIDDEDNCLTCAAAVHRMYRPLPLIYRRRATDAWNHGRIVVIKDSVEHWLNGARVLGFRYHSPDFWAHFDAAKWDSVSARYLTFKSPGNRKGGYLEKGYLGFQAVQGDHWQLRNVRVNAVTPRLGMDEWWSAAGTTGLGGPAGAGAPAGGRAPKAARAGSPRFRSPGNTRVTADGRAF